MATTIARRIRRIGLMPSTYKEVKDKKGVTHTVRVHNFNPELTAEQKAAEVLAIKETHYARREAAKKNPAPAKHRRSKSRKATAKKAA